MSVMSLVLYFVFYLQEIEMPPINWVYGARTPDISERVENTIYRAHKYRNALCELELSKRERLYMLLGRLAPDYVRLDKCVGQLESMLAELRMNIQKEKVRQKTKHPKGLEEVKAKVIEVRSLLKESREKRKTAKHEAYETPAMIAAMKENEDRHKAECVIAKDDANLYWGTEAIVKMACRSFSNGAPPKFKRFTGEGQLAVQLQGGLDCEDAVTKANTLCFIEPTVGKDANCFFRIGSCEGRPVFAQIPIRFHRPLPEGGRIKWAYLERRKMANKSKWSIRLNIDIPMQSGRDIYSWVAVHCGWKTYGDGIRSAVWQGSDGKHGEVFLSSEHLKDYDRLDAVKSKRAGLFNESIEKLIEFANAHSNGELPDWFREKQKSFHLWKSAARLAALVHHWKENRFVGDDIFHSMVKRVKKDKHLWQHERRLSARVAKRRNHQYRNFTSQMSDQYGVLYYSQIEVAKLVKNSAPEELKRDIPQVHRNAGHAAISTLIQFMKEKFPLHAVEVGTENLTRQCANCGEICDGSEADSSKRTYTCQCGKTWDVDDNALANTIAKGKAMRKSGVLLDIAKAHEKQIEERQMRLKKMQDGNRNRNRSKKEKTLQAV